MSMNKNVSIISSMSILIMLLLVVLGSLFITSQTAQYGPGRQEWNYVTVRPKTHLFWWLYYTTADVEHYTERPWMIWLAGGPGSSSCGSGNILQSGPVDVDGNARNHTYVKAANMLYLDNPVGAGISYSEDKTTFVANSTQATDDFMVFLRNFLRTHPEFKKMPLYLYGDSYGGKLAVIYAERILQEIKGGGLDANLKGVGLAYPGIELKGTMRLLGSYLFNWSIADMKGKQELDEIIDEIIKLYDMQLIQAAKAKTALFYKLLADKYGLNSDRITDKDPEVSNRELIKVEELYKRQLHDILGAKSTYDSQKILLNLALTDVFESAVPSVEYLLNNDLKVHVYNGQLDYHVNVYGTSQWIANLNWTGANGYKNAERKLLSIDDVNEGYEKSFGPLAFYWLNRVGHRLPNDSPKVMTYALKKLLGN